MAICRRRVRGDRKILPDWVDGEALRYTIEEDSPRGVVAGRMKVFSLLRLRLEHPRCGSMHLFVSDSREQLGSYLRSKDHLGCIIGMWDTALACSDVRQMRDLVVCKDDAKLPDVARYPEVFVLICCDVIRLAPKQYSTSQQRSNLFSPLDVDVHSETFVTRMYETLNVTVRSLALSMIADAPFKTPVHGPFEQALRAYHSRIDVMQGKVVFHADMSEAEKMLRTYEVFYHDTAPKEIVLKKLCEPLEFHCVALEVFGAMSDVGDLEVAMLRKPYFVDKFEVNDLVVEPVVQGKWVHSGTDFPNGVYEGKLEYRKLNADERRTKKPRTNGFAIPTADEHGQVCLQSAGSLVDRVKDIQLANNYFKIIIDAARCCDTGTSQSAKLLSMAKELIAARWTEIYYPPMYVGLEIPDELVGVMQNDKDLTRQLAIERISPNPVYALLSATFSNTIMEYEVLGTAYDSINFGVKVAYGSPRFPEAQNDGEWLRGAAPWIKKNFHVREINLDGLEVGVKVPPESQYELVNIETIKKGDALILRQKGQYHNAMYSHALLSGHMVQVQHLMQKKSYLVAHIDMLRLKKSKKVELSVSVYAIFHNRFGWLPQFNTLQFHGHVPNQARACSLASQEIFFAMVSSVINGSEVSKYAGVTSARLAAPTPVSTPASTSASTFADNACWLPVFAPSEYQFIRTSAITKALAPALTELGTDAMLLLRLSQTDTYMLLNALATRYATKSERWPFDIKNTLAVFGEHVGAIVEKCT